MGIDEKIDLLNRNYIYEEGIFDFRKLYQNKKKILFECIDIYLRKNPNIGYNKLLQLFYNKIGFEESIEYNANIFNSIDKMDENFCNNLVYMMLHNKPLIDNNNVLTYFESKANLCDSLYKEIGDSDFYSFSYDGEHLAFNDRIKYLKCLIFIKKYGVNSNFIEDFLYAFSEDIDKINISQNILSLFQELLYINTTNNIEELKKIYENIEINSEFIDFFGLHNYIALLFSKNYINDCYKPKKEDLFGNYQGIQIYEAPENCFMLVHVLGGFFLDKINLDNGYKNDWNSRKENYISMSAIGPEFFETCDVKDVCYGFYNFAHEDILGSSVKNLGIHQYTSSEDYFYPESSVSLFGTNRGDDKYCLSKNFLIESRKKCNLDSHIHENEIAYKRYDKNDNIIEPDYIVYFSDDGNEELFKKSIIAAKEFNIPIVMVSKNKWLNYRINNIEEIDNKRR